MTRTATHGDNPALADDPRVVAIVLVRDSSEHLVQSLDTLEAQDHPPSEVVVVHDGAASVDPVISDKFPCVRVLRTKARRSVGSLLNAAVEQASADAYLVQEATDWSHPARLGSLLAAVRQTGAPLVGSAYVAVSADVVEAEIVTLPADGCSAFDADPWFPVIEPATMLFTRALFEDLGGFSQALPVGTLAEFASRAVMTSPVVNVTRPLQFRRVLAANRGSQTAGDFPVMDRVVRAALGERGRAASSSRSHGLAVPDVRLRQPGQLLQLEETGASSTGKHPRPSRARATPAEQDRSTARTDGAERRGVVADAPPIFVVSGFESVSRFVACAIGQHSNVVTVTATNWMSEVAETAARHVREGQAADPSGRFWPPSRATSVYAAAARSVDAMLMWDVNEAGQPAGSEAAPRRWVSALPADRRSLMSAVALYPEARFVHVARAVDAAVVDRLRAGGGDRSELYRSWLAATRAILDVRQLLDEHQVLLVRYEDLAREPAVEMSACLEFVGEAYESGCAALFQARAQDESGDSELVDLPADATQSEARRLSMAIDGRRSSSAPPSTLAEVTRVLAASEPREPGADAVTASTSADDLNPYARSHDLVRRAIPLDAAVAVISKGDERAVHIRCRSVAWHFPQTNDGTYLGYHPRDSAEAIAHLERLRRRGAGYFLVPDSFNWWLTHYGDFGRHLERSYVRLTSRPGEGVLYDLRGRRARTAATTAWGEDAR